jgi:hypothetical protein
MHPEFLPGETFVPVGHQREGPLIWMAEWLGTSEYFVPSCISVEEEQLVKSFLPRKS